MERSVFMSNLRTAILFAVSFFLFAVVTKIWQTDSVNAVLKVLAIAAYVLLLLRIFKKRELITFAGFAVLLIGHNYVWQDEAIHVFWKLAATVVVMLQIGTLGEGRKEPSLTSEN